ncbi:hypothetical protein V502_09275 [Pseudogymnoascus sp. VKM F-4520 (FW-2644)]|nr:hypothetical protein V502_09275 [Pseudogymnoascus sp. VKM F-4520 (FW-2644)]
MAQPQPDPASVCETSLPSSYVQKNICKGSYASALEDRIKCLEEKLIAIHTNPNNHIADVSMPGLAQAFISSPVARPSQSPGRLEPPRLTLQTPSSPSFHESELDDLPSVLSEYTQSFLSWSHPPSATPSVSEHFGPSDVPPWSTTPFSAEPAPNQNEYRNHERSRAMSLCPSETSMQDDFLASIRPQERHKLSINPSQHSLEIPQIEITSWDGFRPQSPTFSQLNRRDMNRPLYCPPELSVGQQFSWPEHDLSEFFYETTKTFPTPILQQTNFPASMQRQTLSPEDGTSRISSQDQTKGYLYNRTFFEVIQPLFPILPQQATQDYPSNDSQSTPSQPGKWGSGLFESQEHSQSLLIWAISSFILSQRCSQPPLLAQHYFQLGIKSHGTGKWDSLPGIQSGILLAIFILVSS